jgi:hypothetical protein
LLLRFYSFLIVFLFLLFNPLAIFKFSVFIPKVLFFGFLAAAHAAGSQKHTALSVMPQSTHLTRP